VICSARKVEDMQEDRISKDGRRAKCAECGRWYGIDEAHGLYSNADHIGALIEEHLKRVSDDRREEVLEYLRNIERFARESATA